MPPKKGDTGKKGGKKGGKKQSEKKRLAELRKKEEEERLRLEEEERQRRIEEKERAIREEEARKKAEEDAIKLAEETKRINEEAVIFDSIRSDRVLKLERLLKEIEQQHEWERYINCSPLPSPEDEADFNSYISLWKSTEERNVESDFSDAEKGIQIAQAIQEHLGNAESNGDPHATEFHLKNLRTVNECIMDTLDKITSHIMQYSEEYLGEGAQFSKTTDNIKFDLWVNLAKNPRMKQIEHSAVQATTEVTMKMALSPLAIRVVQMSIDPLTQTKDDLTDLGEFSPMGGVVFIEILSIPPPAKKIKNTWTVRQVTNLASEIERIPYEKVDPGKAPIPIRVSFVIPPLVIVREETPRIGWWDQVSKTWKVDGITDIQYDPEKRKVSFLTVQLTTAFAVVHPRAYDVPYSNWYYTPVGRRKGLFVITPKNKLSPQNQNPEIHIKIFDSKCKLIRPTDVPELEQFRRKYFSPKTLIMGLANCGINLCLVDGDAKSPLLEGKVVAKDTDLENKMYDDIGYVANVCVLAHSKFNQAQGKNKAVFRVWKNLYDPLSGSDVDYDEDHELEEAAQKLANDSSIEWYVMSYEKTRCGFVKCSEDDDMSAFDSSETREGLQTHLNLYTCMQEMEKRENDVERTVDSGSVVITQTVRQLLNVLRPMSWS